MSLRNSKPGSKTRELTQMEQSIGSFEEKEAKSRYTHLEILLRFTATEER